jgi:hypothetical protein
MTQTLYAHMNKRNLKKRKRYDLHVFVENMYLNDLNVEI